MTHLVSQVSRTCDWEVSLAHPTLAPAVDTKNLCACPTGETPSIGEFLDPVR